jgi:predicted amidohydrolase
MPSPDPIRIAAVQMVSGTRLQDNLTTAEHWLREAHSQGAQLVLLPEYFCLMGEKDTDKCAIAEPQGLGAESPIQVRMASLAKDLGIWIAAGTIPLQSDRPPRIRNSLLVFDPQGRQVACYDKLHLFAFDNGKERYDEARTIAAGHGPVACQTPAGHTGLSVCYDIRFPELYRAMAHPQPLDLILMPAAFTWTTGQAHWEILLRSRAIENQCWLLASAQGGRHDNGRQTWGQSMVIDPWGRVVSQVASGEGLAIADLDPAQTAQVRLNLPALSHRRSLPSIQHT